MSEADDKLVRRYRELAGDEPPPALDAAILAASRRAVASRPWSQRFAGPVSVAAVLVLALGVTLNMQHQKPGVELPMTPEYPAASSGAPEPAAPASLGATAVTGPLSREAAPEVIKPDAFTGKRVLAPDARPDVAPAPGAKPQEKVATAPETFSDSALRTELAKVAPAPTRPEPRAFATPPVVEAVTVPAPASRASGSSARAPAGIPSPAAPETFAYAPAPAIAAAPTAATVAPAAVAPTTVAPAAVAPTTSTPVAVAPPPAFAPSAPPPPARTAAQSRAAPADPEARSGVRPSALAASREKRESADAAPSDALAKSALPLPEPAAELERIARLRLYGHHDLADKALEAFIRKHPDYRIPDAVWDRVKPR